VYRYGIEIFSLFCFTKSGSMYSEVIVKLKTDLGQWAVSEHLVKTSSAELPLLTLKINLKIHHQRNLTPLYRNLLSIGRLRIQQKSFELQIPVFIGLTAEKVLLAVDGIFEGISQELLLPKMRNCIINEKMRFACNHQQQQLHRARSITSLMKFHV
jgi:hypothetical protein